MLLARGLVHSLSSSSSFIGNLRNFLIWASNEIRYMFEKLLNRRKEKKSEKFLVRTANTRTRNIVRKSWKSWRFLLISDSLSSTFPSLVCEILEKLKEPENKLRISNINLRRTKYQVSKNLFLFYCGCGGAMSGITRNVQCWCLPNTFVILLRPNELSKLSRSEHSFQQAEWRVEWESANISTPPHMPFSKAQLMHCLLLAQKGRKDIRHKKKLKKNT